MKIHEYQAKELMGAYGIPVPSGILALTADEAYEAAKQIGPCVVKAQIHSGGRGKGGGVQARRGGGAGSSAVIRKRLRDARCSKQPRKRNGNEHNGRHPREMHRACKPLE